MNERLLGLRVQSRRATAASAALLFAYYAWTMCRSLSMYDSPELALAAEQVGLGHPFGQPLHTIIGALLTRLPGIDPLIALNGLSAVAGALTVIAATSFAQALMRPVSDSPRGDPRFVAPTIALVGMHPAIWEPSTRIEVYSLAAFFALWAAARFTNALLDGDPRSRAYLETGLGLGLSAATNIACALGVTLAMTPRFVMAIARREIPTRAWRAVLIGGLLGLTTYAYVFLVARRVNVFVWGSPVDAASIKHYFTAADFRQKGVSSWLEWFAHVKDLVLWSVYNGLFAVLVMGFAGYAIYARKRGLGRFFFNATLIFFLALIARNGVFAPDVLDYAGYLAIPAWIAASGIGLLVAYLAERRLSFAAVALAAVLLLLLVSPPAIYERTRRRDELTSDIANSALRAAPPNAVVIVERDHWIGPIWYVQEQRDVRPDVVVIAYGLSSSTWFWQHLYRRHPNLAPFELRGPGGREARLRRFLAANPNRPVQIERVALAQRIGLPTCPSDWLLDVRTTCGDTADEPALARVVSTALADLQEGSPGTDGLIALLTLDRGHDLYSQGFPRAAIKTLLAGVPGIVGVVDADLSTVPPRIEASFSPAPSYEPPTALGHPAQNLSYAAMIARATGAQRLGSDFAGLSDALGPVRPKFEALPASPANL